MPVESSRILRISGRHELGIPLPFFRFKDNPLKFLLSSKQIEFCRRLFSANGTKIWKEWPVSALLHEDYLDMADSLEKVDAVLDESFEAGLYWHHHMHRRDQSVDTSEIDLIVEGADSTSEWLQDQAFSQAMIAGGPQFKELLIHPVCIDEEGERLSKRTNSQSADSLVYGALKLNNEVQYGMGAEVFRLWAASVTSDVPQTNTIVLAESFIGSLGVISSDQKREELNLLRKILWQASTVLSSSRDNTTLTKESEELSSARPLNKAIEAQYKFFCSTVSRFYQQRNLSGAYSGLVDFLKFHYMDMIMPFLIDNIKQRGDAHSYRMLSKIHRDTLLLGSPILPFSSEEAFHHSFGRSMYEVDGYYLPGQAARTVGSDIDDLQNYRLIYDIKTKLIELHEKVSHGESRKTRHKFDLLVLYPQKALEMRGKLESLDLVDLARFLDVKSIRLEQEELQDFGSLEVLSRGTFKLRRCTFKLTAPRGIRTSSSKKDSDIEIS